MDENEITKKAIATERELRNLPATPPDLTTDDGWDDAAREDEKQLIRGQLIKFVDGDWMPTNSTTLMNGRHLLATATVAAWVRWADSRPAEYIVRRPHEDLPRRNELGHLDKAHWAIDSRGAPKDPFQNTRFTQLLDAGTAEVFTFSTSSEGGRIAVNELGSAIRRKRSISGRNLIPVVELIHAPFKTHHGMKKRPLLKIIGWRSHGGFEPPAKPPPPDDEPPPYDMPDDDLHDRIPF
jgi:hypothetical protein